MLCYIEVIFQKVFSLVDVSTQVHELLSISCVRERQVPRSALHWLHRHLLFFKFLDVIWLPKLNTILILEIHVLRHQLMGLT